VVSTLLLLVYWIVLRPLHVSVAVENGFETLSLVLWPSSFWLMAARGMDLVSLSILGFALVTNGVLYAFIGLLALAVRNTAFRLRAKQSRN